MHGGRAWRERGTEAGESHSPGFTLIELTVVLAVIVTLALMLTPAITNFIADSRTARARNDAQILEAALLQFYKDTGLFPQWSASNGGGAGRPADVVDLLVSPGNVPAVAAANTWTTGASAPLEDQLMTNAPAYAMKGAAAPFGWNGPYLSSEIGSDPWNNRYAVNIGLVDTTQGTQTADGATKSAVWVLSAGANGRIDTPYTQPITTASPSGDDVAVRVQ